MNQRQNSSLIDQDLVDRREQVSCLIERYLRRYGYRLLGTDMGITVQEAGITLGLTPHAEPLAEVIPLMSPEVIEQRLVIVEERMLSRAAAALEEDTSMPFDELQAAFELDTPELRALAVLLMYQTRVEIQRLCRMAWADFTMRQPTVGFLLELVCDDEPSREVLTRSLGPGGRLRTFQLMRLVEPHAWPGACPLLQLLTHLPERIERFLLHGREVDPAQSSEQSSRPWWLEPPLPSGGGKSDALAFAPGVEQAITAALSGRHQRGAAPKAPKSPPRLLLTGRPGSGRRALLRTLSHAENHPLLILDLERWLDSARDAALASLGTTSSERASVNKAALSDTIQEVMREAMLHQAIILVRNADYLEHDPALNSASRAALTLLDTFPRRLVFSSKTPLNALRRSIQNLIEVDIPTLDEQTQRGLWTGLLPSFKPAERSQLAHALARQYAMSPGGIARAIQQASSIAASRRGTPKQLALRPEDILQAVRSQFDHGLSALAEPITTQMLWKDLILPPSLMEDLDEIINIMRHRHTVYDLWGFRAKLDTGRGTACLFSGPPGTGKTMTASLLARELGREAYRVDLSRIVDKYIGETEKNLSRVFDEAERAQAVLIFDEADSLFSKRTEVKSSNDRYANLEVNFLLQRLERFDGISILTTNFESSIDEAFKRRIRFRITFPFPDKTQRVSLWQAMIPSQASIDPDIDWESLALHYEIAGGNIKNVVLRAAFEAARLQTPINDELLHKAAVKECREMGQLIRNDEHPHPNLT